MKLLTKSRTFYDNLRMLKKHIILNIEEKILRYSILSKLYKLNEYDIKNLIKLSKNYELKKNLINTTLEEYYYEEIQDTKIKNWILEIIREKNLLHITRETNFISKRSGITYKLNATNFLKIIEIQNNQKYTEEKKELYKQLILNFSNNLKVENLESTIDILLAVRHRDKKKISQILQYNQSLQRLFKSSLRKKQSRIIKIKKLLILTYWPVGCLSQSLFSKILTQNYRYLIDEVLTLKYDEILKYLRTIKTLSLNEIFYKGSNKNFNFNYFLSEFVQYTPKDFQNTLKTYISSLEHSTIKQYLEWFFKDKVPNKWNDFIFAIKYIEKHKLINLNDNIENITIAKFKAEEFFVSFEKMNFNPYADLKILQNKHIKITFLQNVIKYIKDNTKKIDTYGWIAFYIYADEDDKAKFTKDIESFFKNKNFEIQNQIFVYFLSFYSNIDKKNFKFISEIMTQLDESKIKIPKKIINMQKTSPYNLNYHKSYILIKSLTLRTSVFKKILNKNINIEEFKTEKLLPAIYYIASHAKSDHLSEQLKEEKTMSTEQRKEIMGFITFLNQEQNNFNFNTL